MTTTSAQWVLLADVHKQLDEGSLLNATLNKLETQPYPSNSDTIDISCSGTIGKLNCVFLAGDLTNDGGEWNGGEQSNLFKYNPSNYLGGGDLKIVHALYDKNNTRDGVTQVTGCGPLYFGIGNHDISDQGHGAGWRYFNNSYSPISDFFRYQMWNFVAQMQTGLSEHHKSPPYPIAAENIDSTSNGSYDWKHHSLNYVVDLGPVDVYQLHLFGGDVNHGHESGISWLQQKLAEKGYQRPVVIVQHFLLSAPYEEDSVTHDVKEMKSWTRAARDHLLEVLLPYNVLAVCVGHYHGTGQLPNLILWSNKCDTFPSTYIKPDVPEIRPGAAKDKRFGLFRVDAPAGDSGSVKTTILYGDVSDSGVLNWNHGWSHTATAPKVYVRDIKVCPYDKEDENEYTLPTVCTELTGQSRNTNEGFGGKHVYIRPLLTTSKSDAITGIYFWQSEEKDEHYVSISEGAKGTNRYIKPIRDSSLPGITGLFLLRSEQPMTLPNYPDYDGMTGNLNYGRDGDYLYLVWKCT